MTVRRGHLLFLGAGPNQLPAIERAVELGYQVTTVDNAAGSPGHRLSHGRELCSTVDAAGMLAIARRLAIDGVATFASDVAAPTVASVARALGLPGALPAAVTRLSMKTAFRQLQQELGLPHPAFAPVDEPGALASTIAGLAGELVFKPEDSSGSRGISSAPSEDLSACARAYELARRYARCGRVCVEQRIEGTHISADGYIAGGRIAEIVCTAKQRDGYLVRGHVGPFWPETRALASLRQQVDAIASRLGFDVGFFDLDAVIVGGGVVLVEMSPRLGGNGIPTLVECATGLRLIDALFSHAMGEPVELRAWPSHRVMASWVFGSDRAGTLRDFVATSELTSRCPEVRYLLRAREIGDRVSAMENNGDLLGYAVFELAEGIKYDDMVARIGAELGLVVA
jgi:biotin carboxylase